MAIFLEATFLGFANFYRTIFDYGVIFLDAKFRGGANFKESTLRGNPFNPL
jgi:hypothetical protein